MKRSFRRHLLDCLGIKMRTTNLRGSSTKFFLPKLQTYMQRVFSRLGFTYCGRIRYEAGERMAYEKQL